MANEWLTIELIVWFLTIKMFDKRAETCRIGTCDTLLESCFQGHKFTLKIFWIRYVRVMNLQSYKTQNLKFWEFQNSPFGSPWKLCHFDVVPITIYKIYYRDENDDSFQVWAAMSHLNACFPWFHLCNILVPICTNFCPLSLIVQINFTLKSTCELSLVPSSFFVGIRKHTLCIHPTTIGIIIFFLPLYHLANIGVHQHETHKETRQQMMNIKLWSFLNVHWGGSCKLHHTKWMFQ
jgi:hypothetical protein